MSNKEKFELEIKNLMSEVSEKERELSTLQDFSRSQGGTQGKLEGLRSELDDLRRHHESEREALKSRLEQEINEIEEEWRKQLRDTKESLMGMTERNLNKNTRR